MFFKNTGFAAVESNLFLASYTGDSLLKRDKVSRVWVWQIIFLKNAN
jgi:hypothetical protein